MHKFLMADKNPRVPEEPMNDLQREKVDNIVWKYKSTHENPDIVMTEGDERKRRKKPVEFLEKWLFDDQNPEHTRQHVWRALRSYY